MRVRNRLYLSGLSANVAVWTLLALLFTVQAKSRPDLAVPFSRVFAQIMATFVPCMLLTPAIAKVAFRYRFAPGRRAVSLAAHAVALPAFLVVGGMLMGTLVWLLPWNRTGSLPAAAVDGVVRYLASDVLVYGLVSAGFMAYAYARESRARSNAAAALQAQLVEARLHALTAQLQPHFLFNTLNAISALVRDDPLRAERLLMQLSDLLRHSLREGSAPETSLENELSFLEKYVEVQEARFGSRLQVNFEVDPQVLDARVPRLLLQPLVENAIRHGIAPRPGPGTVEIAARQEGTHVRLRVSDDGLGVSPAGLTEGIGLRATRARLTQMYGADHEFALVNQPRGGVECTLLLPLRRSETS